MVLRYWRNEYFFSCLKNTFFVLHDMLCISCKILFPTSRLSVHPCVCASVRPSVRRLAPIPAGESQDVTNKSCSICLRGDPWGPWRSRTQNVPAQRVLSSFIHIFNFGRSAALVLYFRIHSKYCYFTTGKKPKWTFYLL